jgi:hypothetical protein
MKPLRSLAALLAGLSLPLGALAQDAKPSATLTPYANIHLGAYFTGGTLAAQDFPGQAVLTGPGAGSTKPVSNGSFIESARASRIGLRGAVDDNNWTGAAYAGFVEFDFAGGQFPGTQTVTCTSASPPVCTLNSPAAATASTSWYNALPRLRFASATATWKTPMGALSLLAGQDWALLNGLAPEALGYMSTQLFTGAGNLTRRTPQLRATWAGSFDVLSINLAVAALTPVSTAPVDDGPGNLSRRPDLEGRLGVVVKPMADVSVGAAVSYSSGARRFNFLNKTQKDVDVNALGAEVEISATKYLQLKGEYYAGKGMDDAYSGIAPAGVGGVPAATATTTTSANYVAIRGVGYWGQAILKPIPEVWLTGGMGQEQVNKDDLVALAAAATTRSKNQMVTGGLLFNAGKSWRFGLEYTQDTSTYGGFGTRVKEERKAQQIALSTLLRL